MIRGAVWAATVSAIAAMAIACGGGGDPNQSQHEVPAEDEFIDPGSRVSLALSSDQVADLTLLEEQLADVESLTTDDFATRYAVQFGGAPGTDPAGALGMDLIQASLLSLTDGELARLNENGFVISDRQSFGTFASGYEAVYMQDLPVFISADSVLYAVHRSYDSLLKQLEQSELSSRLEALLASARAGLSNSALDAEVAADIDFYLTMAHSLLRGQALPCEAGGSSAEVQDFFNRAQAGSGVEPVQLFGANRGIDFSQFIPRGHYTDSELLSRYFQAMMWLGRIDLRLIETQEDGSQVFRRRQLELALGIWELLDGPSRDGWSIVDSTISAFVGEHDSMTPPELDLLLADLGISSVAELETLPDERIAQAIVDGGYGTQRIASHFMVNGLGNETLPLSSSWLLFGQRYTVDSHVLSNVVYDRVVHDGAWRMMPSPLDVAFAALGNDQAGTLLGPELEEYSYAPELASMRALSDSYPDAFWQSNLYNLWFGSLRELSPDDEVSAPAETGLPNVAGTAAWGRRMLNTQLASWAELRHDTILYAKQSYTMGVSCEFPDGYVEPYPQFFARLGEYAAYGLELVADLRTKGVGASLDGAEAYFQRLGTVMRTLQEMAENQRTGTPHTRAHIDFINQAVRIQYMCGGAYAEGWYSELFYGGGATEFDPTIADVHTQPTDEAGNMVGRVLHVGTGHPRMIVTTFDTCAGLRAYVGVVSSYYEHITEDFERLTDDQWATQVEQDPPADPAWVQSLMPE